MHDDQKKSKILLKRIQQQAGIGINTDAEEFLRKEAERLNREEQKAIEEPKTQQPTIIQEPEQQPTPSETTKTEKIIPPRLNEFEQLEKRNVFSIEQQPEKTPTEPTTTTWKPKPYLTPQQLRELLTKQKSEQYEKETPTEPTTIGQERDSSQAKQQIQQPTIPDTQKPFLRMDTTTIQDTSKHIIDTLKKYSKPEPPVSTQTSMAVETKRVLLQKAKELQEKIDLAKEEFKKYGGRLYIYDQHGNRYNPYRGVANYIATNIYNLFSSNDVNTQEMAYGTITQALMSGEEGVMGVYHSLANFIDYANEYLIKPTIYKDYIPEPERKRKEYEHLIKNRPKLQYEPIKNFGNDIESLSKFVETDKDFNLETRVKIAYNFLKNKGLRDEQILGIIGALFGESKLNPYAVNPKSLAFGIAQWLGDRKYDNERELKISITGNPYVDLQAQLEYLWYELNSNEIRTLDLIKSSNSIDDTLIKFTTSFLRPAEHELNLNQRINAIRKIIKNIKDFNIDEETQNKLLQKFFKIKNWDEFIEHQKKLEEAGRINETAIGYFLAGMRGSINSNTLNETMSALGSTTIFIPTGFLVTTLTAGLGLPANFATMLGAWSSAILESMTEAGDVYNQIKQDPNLQDKVNERVLGTLFSNAILNYAIDKFAYFDKPFKKFAFNNKLLNFTKNTALEVTPEVIQESAQQIINNVATDNPPFEGVKEQIIPIILSTLTFQKFFNAVNKLDKLRSEGKLSKAEITQKKKEIIEEAVNNLAYEVDPFYTMEYEQAVEDFKKGKKTAIVIDPTTGEKRILVNPLKSIQEYEPVIQYGEIKNEEELEGFKKLVETKINENQYIPVHFNVFSNNESIQKEIDIIQQKSISPHNEKFTTRKNVDLDLVSKALFEKTADDLQHGEISIAHQVLIDLQDNNITQASIREIREHYKQYYSPLETILRPVDNETIAHAIFGKSYEFLNNDQKYIVNYTKEKLTKNNKWLISTIEEIRDAIFPNGYVTRKSINDRNDVATALFNKGYDELNEFEKLQVDYAINNLQVNENTNVIPADVILEEAQKHITKTNEFEKFILFLKDIKSKLFGTSENQLLNPFEALLLKEINNELNKLNIQYITQDELEKSINKFKDEFEVISRIKDKLESDKVTIYKGKVKNLASQIANSINELRNKKEIGYAERTGEEITPTSPEEGTIGGTPEGIHIWDTEKNRVEAQPSEEKEKEEVKPPEQPTPAPIPQTKPPEEESSPTSPAPQPPTPPEAETPPPQQPEEKPPKPSEKEPKLPENIAQSNKTASVKTPLSFKEIKIKYIVAEADDIQTSHDHVSFQPNSKYTAFQPRGRESSALQEQVIKISNNLQPELLSEDATTTGGRPIVDANLNVESGNGRTMAIKRAYDLNLPSAEKYQRDLVKNEQKLKELGFSEQEIQKILSMKKPILVGVRLTELTKDELQNYIAESNQSEVASASLLEIAKKDVQKIEQLNKKEGKDILTLYNPNEDLSSKENEQFVKFFYDNVLDTNEKNQYISGNVFTDNLYDRIENALFYYAIRSDKIGRLFIEGSETGRRIINAINKAISKIIYAKTNELIKPYDISDKIANALEWIFRYSIVVDPEKGYYNYDTYVANQSMFGDEGRIKLDKVSAWIADFIVKKRNLQADLTKFFNSYYNMLYNFANPPMFAEFPVDLQKLFDNRATLQDYFNKFAELYNKGKIKVDVNVPTLVNLDEINEKTIPAGKKDALERIIGLVNELYEKISKVISGKSQAKTTIDKKFNELNRLLEENSLLGLYPINRTEKYDPDNDLSLINNLAKVIKEKFGYKEGETPQPSPAPTTPTTTEKSPTPETTEKPKETPKEKPTTEETPKEKPKIRIEDIINKNPLDLTPEELEEYEKYLNDIINRQKNLSQAIKPEPVSKGTITFKDLSPEDKLRIIRRLKVIKDFEQKYLNGRNTYEVTIDEFNQAVTKAKTEGYNVDFSYFEIINFAIQEGNKQALEVLNKVKKERKEFEEKLLKVVKESKKQPDYDYAENIFNEIKEKIKTKNYSDKTKKLLLYAVEIIQNNVIKKGSTKVYLNNNEVLLDFANYIHENILTKDPHILDNPKDREELFDYIKILTQKLGIQGKFGWLNSITLGEEHEEFRQNLINKIRVRRNLIFRGITVENGDYSRLAENVYGLYKTIKKYASDERSNTQKQLETIERLINKRAIDLAVYEYVADIIIRRKVFDEQSLRDFVEEFYTKLNNEIAKLSSDRSVRVSINSSEYYYNSVVRALNEIEKLIKLELRAYSDIISSGGLNYKNSLVVPDIIVINEKLLPKNYTIYVKEGDNKYDSPDFKLDSHQILGINLALNSFIDNNNRGFMLCDGTGLGKTAQILVVSNEYVERNKNAVAFIVVPNKQIAEGSYKNDAEKLKIRNVVNLTDSKVLKAYINKNTGAIAPEKLDKGKIYIVTYNNINKLKNINIDLLVLDESHKLKNVTSARTQNYMNLKANKKMFVTATPTDKIVGFAYFVADMFGDRSMEEVLADFGLSYVPIYDRDTGEIVRHVLQPKQGISYREVINRILEKRNELIRKGMLLRRETRFLGNVNIIELTADEDIQEAMDRILIYRLQTMYNKTYAVGVAVHSQKKYSEMKKAELLWDRIKQDIDNGEKVIIVGDYHNKVKLEELGYDEKNPLPSSLGYIMEQLDKAGIKYAKILGTRDKAEEIRKFQDDEVNVAVMTPQSGGVGVNLDDRTGNKPRKMYVVGLNFAGDVFEQLVGRVSRRTTRSFSEINIAVFGNLSIDNHVREILQEKLSVMWATQIGADPDDVVVDVGTINTHQDVNDNDVANLNDVDIVEEGDGDISYYIKRDEAIKEINENTEAIDGELTDQYNEDEVPDTTTDEIPDDVEINTDIYITLRQVLNTLIKGLKLRQGWSLRTGKAFFNRYKIINMLKKEVAGIHDSSVRAIIAKKLSAFDVILHEIGHHIDRYYFRSFEEILKGNRYRNIVEKFVLETGLSIQEIFEQGKKFLQEKDDIDWKKYKPEDIPPEVIAEGIKFYIISVPDNTGISEFERKAPLFYKFLQAIIDEATREYKSIVDLRGTIEQARTLFILYSRLPESRKLAGEIQYSEDDLVSDLFATNIIGKIKSSINALRRGKNELIRQVFNALQNIKILTLTGKKFGVFNSDRVLASLESLLGNSGKITQFIYFRPFNYSGTTTIEQKKSAVTLPFVIEKNVKPIAEIFSEVQKNNATIDLETYLVAKRIKGWIETVRMLNDEINKLNEQLKNQVETEQIKEAEKTKKRIDELTQIKEHYKELVSQELEEIAEVEKYTKNVKEFNPKVFIENVIKQLEAKNENLPIWAEEVYKYIDALREYMISTGLYDRDQIQQLKKYDPYYVPFYRHFDNWEFTAKYPRTGSIPRPIVGEVIKRMKGSTRGTEPIFNNIIKLTQMTISQGERNRALIQLATFLYQLNDKINDIYKNGTPEEIKQLEKLLELYPALGNKLDTGLIIQIAPPPPNAKLKRGEIEVKINGERQYYSIPVELYDDIFSLEEGIPNNLMIKILSYFTAIRRGLLTGLSLGFGFFNIFRDQQSILARSQEFVNPLKLPKAYLDFVKKNDIYQYYLISGADISFLGEINKKILETYIVRHKGYSIVLKSKLKRYVSSPKGLILLISDIIRLGEIGGRLQVFTETLLKTKDINQALVEAHNVLANYALSGTSNIAKSYFSINAFFLANLKHLYQDLKATPKVFTTRLPRMMAFLFFPAFILRMFMLMNDDDREYLKKLNPIIKHMFFVFRIPYLNVYVKIPKVIWGFIFGNAGEFLAEQIFGEEIDTDDKFEEIKDAMATLYETSITPINNWYDLAPDILTILAGIESNYSGFYGRPSIESIYSNKIPEEFRISPSTRPISIIIANSFNKFLTDKKLDKVIGKISPQKLEYSLRYFLGDYYDMSAFAELLIMGKDYERFPFDTWEVVGVDYKAIPIINRFLIKPQSYLNSYEIVKFYKRLDELESIYRGLLKGLSLDEQTGIEYFKKNIESQIKDEKNQRDLLTYIYCYPEFNKVRQTLKDIKTLRYILYYQNKENREEIKEFIPKLDYVAYLITKELLDRYKDIQKLPMSELNLDDIVRMRMKLDIDSIIIQELTNKAMESIREANKNELNAIAHSYFKHLEDEAEIYSKIAETNRETLENYIKIMKKHIDNKINAEKSKK